MAKFAWLTSMWKPAQAEKVMFRDTSQLRTFVTEKLPLHYEDVKDIKFDENDTAIFSANINGQLITGDVTNLFGYLKAYQDEEPKGLIEGYIRGLIVQRNVTEENLLVVVRTKDYVDYINQQSDGAVSGPLVGELYVLYMADGADTMSPIKTTEMTGKTLPELRKIALSNVRKWLPKIKNDEAIGPILLYYVEGNTMLSSSLVLLDEFWAMVKASVSSDVYLALPRRDQLFIMDAKYQDALPALHKLIELTAQDGFNLLSNHLYRRRNRKLEVVSN
jgi:hypothetical protein